MVYKKVLFFSFYNDIQMITELQQLGRINLSMNMKTKQDQYNNFVIKMPTFSIMTIHARTRFN